MKNLWWASKLFFWVMMIPMLLIDVGELTLNNAWDLTVFLIVLAGSPVILMAMSALLCGLANRDEFVPAFLASSIFATLSRPDLAAANFDVAESEAPHDAGSVRVTRGAYCIFGPQTGRSRLRA
jgi:hypothetical protein